MHELARLRAEKLSGYVQHGSFRERDDPLEPCVMPLLALNAPEEVKQKMARIILFDSNLDFVTAVRTPSARGKFQQRKGVKSWTSEMVRLKIAKR